MSISELMTALQDRGIVLQAVGDRIDFQAPPDALTSELLDHMVAHKPELLAELRKVAQPKPADELRQTAFEGGEVSRDQAKALAVLAAQVAHELPEVAHPAEDTGTVEIPAEVFLQDICPACKQSAWRTKSSGQRVCSVCHPAPENSQPPAPSPPVADTGPVITRQTPMPPEPVQVSTPQSQIELPPEPEPPEQACVRCGCRTWWWSSREFFCDMCLANLDGHRDYEPAHKDSDKTQLNPIEH